MITKIKQFISSIFERALSYADTNNIIMIREMTKQEIKIVLYDYVTHEIQAYSSSTSVKGEYFVNDRVSANKGWGPFMHELLLQSVYPLGIKPSDMIRPQAISIWNRFLQNSNVKTQLIPSTSINYATVWKPDEFAEPVLNADNELNIINRVYKLHPYNYFQPYVQHSEEIIAQQNINKKKILRDALDFFHSKYYVESFIYEKVLSIPQKDVTGKYLLINKEGNTVQFLIQDKAKIYAYGELTNDSKYYQTKNIAADQGWGPFLYDTIMLMLDKPIHPSVSLTIDSFTVLNNYLYNRPDVIKTLYPGKLYTGVDLDHKMQHEEKYYKVLNYLYTINNTERREQTNSWYKTSLQFEQQMVDKMPNWKQIRFNQAKRWFNLNYPVAA